MRVGLLFPDADLELDALPEPDPDLVADLELERLFAAMAADDARIAAVVRRVVPLAVRGAGEGTTPADAVVRHRGPVVADAIASPATMRALYERAVAAVEAERRVWGSAVRGPELVLRRSVEVLGLLLDAVADVRDILARDRGALHAAALLDFADRLAADADDAFLAAARDALRQLDERTLVVTAGLGAGNRPGDFVLRRPGADRASLRDRVGLDGHRSLTVTVALRDQNAMNALAELRARSVAPAAGSVAESAAHLLAFCRRLRDEAAFLVGCANLDVALARRHVPRCTPGELESPGGPGLTAEAIVDPCLALATGSPVVGNDVDTVGRPLAVVTGANGGGKSTLLRAVGVARVLQAAGLPVAATAFRSALPADVLVHFPRGEADADSGRLEAELARLDALVARARPGSLVLLNEPLSNVNERDGSAIADALVRGLVAGGAEVWLVTHHHGLAVGLHADPPGPTRFLRAERGEGDARPFRVVEAPPLATSFGADLWDAEMGSGEPG